MKTLSRNELKQIVGGKVPTGNNSCSASASKCGKTCSCSANSGLNLCSSGISGSTAQCDCDGIEVNISC